MLLCVQFNRPFKSHLKKQNTCKRKPSNESHPTHHICILRYARPRALFCRVFGPELGRTSVLQCLSHSTSEVSCRRLPPQFCMLRKLSLHPSQTILQPGLFAAADAEHRGQRGATWWRRGACRCCRASFIFSCRRQVGVTPVLMQQLCILHYGTAPALKLWVCC
jgi:hypothetical protein